MPQTRRKSIPMLALLLAAVLAGAAGLSAQSVADLARKERARKGGEAGSGKVFTNDDVSTGAPRPTPSTAAAGAEAAAGEGEAADAETEEADGDQEPTREELEKQYREQFAVLKENLDTEQRRLDVLQRELNLSQMQYYGDPNVAMREQVFREEINQRTEEIEKQKEIVAGAQAAIDDLETELRQKSLPPGWAR